VNPTEDPEKVKKALSIITPNQDFEEVKKGDRSVIKFEMKGRESLDKLFSKLRDEMILDAARKALFSSTKGNVISFCLNKQVASAGHISFCQPTGESPLGPISVEIRCANSEALIEWLAPGTSRKQ
jgi:predicted RNA binding protein with dsRBD fold (UPF0201 family)